MSLNVIWIGVLSLFCSNERYMNIQTATLTAIITATTIVKAIMTVFLENAGLGFAGSGFAGSGFSSAHEGVSLFLAIPTSSSRDT